MVFLQNGLLIIYLYNVEIVPVIKKIRTVFQKIGKDRIYIKIIHVIQFNME